VNQLSNSNDRQESQFPYVFFILPIKVFSKGLCGSRVDPLANKSSASKENTRPDISLISFELMEATCYFVGAKIQLAFNISITWSKTDSSSIK
jgi:hypothetical protein